MSCDITLTTLLTRKEVVGALTQQLLSSLAAVLSSPLTTGSSVHRCCCLKVSASASPTLSAPLDSQLAHHTPAHVIHRKNNLLNALEHGYFIV